MREVLITRWNDTGSRVVGLAESFPEESYGFRPTPEVRSFAEQLRHVAFWNDYLRDSLRGANPDGAANELSADEYPTRAKILRALRESFDEVHAELASASGDAAIGSKELDMLVGYIEHAGEHYGQLVVYARLCGVTPPASLAGV
jgi:uncharacterized damage-inducible protein DinB